MSRQLKALLPEKNLAMPKLELPITAFILSGGLGTRLRDVVSDRPKPMALIDGKPFLEILVLCLAQKGVRHFVFLTGYRGEAIEDHFMKHRPAGSSIAFSREPEPLGTGGAVKLAERFAGDPTLLVNGDTYFDCDLKALCDFHLERKPLVTLSLRYVQDVSRYGSVTVDDKGFVTGFTEKGGGAARAGLINAGVSMLSMEFIKSLPPGRAFSMERDVFPEVAASGRMAGLQQEGDFFDIGTPESYEAFSLFMKERQLR